MPGNLKRYYLIQSAYWLQQFLVLVLRLEKPRSDFVELCVNTISQIAEALRLCAHLERPSNCKARKLITDSNEESDKEIIMIKDVYRRHGAV